MATKNHKLLHVCITRFNLARKLVLPPKWLEGRVSLFEQYCLSSLMAQTEKNFIWYVLFDERSPDWLVKKTKAWEKQCKQFVPVKCGAWKQVTVSSCVTDLIQQAANKEKATHILTTRFDNDDGLNERFIALLQQNVRKQFFNFMVYDFPEGLRLDYNAKKAYHYTRPHSPFLSLLQRYPDPSPKRKFLTIYGFPEGHGFIWKYAPIRMLMKKTPMWVQVIHDTNISNKMKGTEKPADLNKIKGFDFLVDF